MPPKKSKKKIEKQLEQTKVSTDLELPKIEFIEKEITLDEKYSTNLKKIEDELVDEGYIDPLRTLNLGRLLSTNFPVNNSKKKKETNFNRDLIISVLNNIEPKIAKWINRNNIKNQNILVLKVKKNENSNLGFDKLLIEELKIYQELIKNKGYDQFIKIIKNQKFNIFKKIKQKIVDPENKFLLKEIKEQVINEIDWNIEKKENEFNDLRLIIDLENFYVQGFINKDKTYFYYDENKNIDIIILEIRKIGIKNCFPLNLKVTYDDNLNIKISKEYLNKAIDNLKNIKLQEKNEFNTEIKKDLIALVFTTSEAMRFKMNIEDFTDNENYSNEINDLKLIKNILSCVQEVINDDQKTIKWKDYKEQLNNWSKVSKKCFDFRNQIYSQLLTIKKVNDFFIKKKMKF